ncbi:molybdopterin converting factor [Candidatus Pacearchaeota archaeon]|nr:molybdopterin converting factor [Candidatus Pacearchaeota archaeon]|tara:strand:- start:239 stop:499 length:261 start_codon:yes stop_codon:yes gene_type:complete
MSELTPEGGSGAVSVLIINNDGGGFADKKEFPAGTTVAQAFRQEVGEERSPSNYLMRVNRQPCTTNQLLKDGDRLSITPTKIEGAS